MKPYYQDDKTTLYHGDSNEILESMPCDFRLEFTS